MGYFREWQQQLLRWYNLYQFQIKTGKIFTRSKVQRSQYFTVFFAKITTILLLYKICNVAAVEHLGLLIVANRIRKFK